MTTVASCSVAAFHRDSVVFPLPPNGSERRFGPFGRPTRCHDCGVRPGAFHHPGCDMAECPVCHGQLMCCGCRFDEDGENPDENDW